MRIIKKPVSNNKGKVKIIKKNTGNTPTKDLRELTFVNAKK